MTSPTAKSLSLRQFYVQTKPPETVECLFVEINIRKNKNNISNHLPHLNKGLDVYLKHYDNLLILGDLNSESKGSC